MENIKRKKYQKEWLAPIVKQLKREFLMCLQSGFKIYILATLFPIRFEPLFTAILEG